MIDEDEAKTVRDIFWLRLAGWTLQAISDYLNHRGIAPRRNGKWYPSSVRYILDNPKYKGKVEYYFRWQDENLRVLCDGEHSPIIGSNRKEGDENA